MRKFIVEANMRGVMFNHKFFSSRNTAIRYARKLFAWHGCDVYINGKRKFVGDL